MENLRKNNKPGDRETSHHSNRRIPGSQFPYEVKNEKNRHVGTSILLLYFGDLWKFALDKLNSQVDGFLMTIRYEGHEFRIYRNSC